MRCLSCLDLPSQGFTYEQIVNYWRSRRHAAVNGRRDSDQGVEFVVGEPDAAGLLNPVLSAGLTTTSHRHGQTDQVLLSFTQ